MSLQVRLGKQVSQPVSWEMGPIAKKVSLERNLTHVGFYIQGAVLLMYMKGASGKF